MTFEVSVAVYAATNPDQATQAGDVLLIDVLRADTGVLVKHTCSIWVRAGRKHSIDG